MLRADVETVIVSDGSIERKYTCSSLAVYLNENDMPSLFF